MATAALVLGAKLGAKILAAEALSEAATLRFSYNDNNNNDNNDNKLSVDRCDPDQPLRQTIQMVEASETVARL